MAAKLARFFWVPCGLAAAVVIVAGRLLAVSLAITPLEFAVYDRVVRSSAAAPSGDIVIITIDDASIARLGEWPWAHDVHVRLLDRLRAAGANVVGFTSAFDTVRQTDELERLRSALGLLESSKLGRSGQAQQLRRLIDESASRDRSAQLAQAMAAHGDVVLPIDLRIDASASEPAGLPPRLLPPAEAPVLRLAASAAVAKSPVASFIGAASAVGHTYFPADGDGEVRSDATAIRVGASLVPSLATAIAARARGIAPDQVTFDAHHRVHIAGATIPATDDLRVRPHYFQAAGAPGDRSSFTRYSYWQVLAGEIPPAQLRNKVVVVGLMDTNAAASSAIATPAGDATPAVVATASAVSSLLSGAVYSRPAIASALEWGAALAVIVFVAVALPAAGPVIGGLASLLVIAILAISEIGLLTSTHQWLHLMLLCVAVAVGFGVYLIGALMRGVNAGAATRDAAAEAVANLRKLGQTFQRQGQLDLAFETYQRCPLDAATMELLYYLGMDFERRAQLPKASAVYAYIATRDPNYRDLYNRRARVREEPLTRAPARRATPAEDRSHRESLPHAAAHQAGMSASTAQRTLGRYEIERELGKGAMGVVYLGRDPKINRVVAIKAIALAEEFEGDDLAEARARFFREAEMAGRLNHPAIVTVYDAGEDQGLAYIAMEYLRGRHLSHFTDAKRLLPYRTVMLLIARVAEALHYAHRQNVVHRDIKPANIMFDPDTDELKITDFGIARLTDTSRTKTGIVLGTPSFMAPEQLEGRTLDGRSDQFALAVSLYQLLCGQLPFRAESMPRLMQKIATEPHASVRALRPELPECIDTILNRALTKSADERYANCAALAAALRSCAAGQQQAHASEASHEWLIP